MCHKFKLKRIRGNVAMKNKQKIGVVRLLKITDTLISDTLISRSCSFFKAEKCFAEQV